MQAGARGYIMKNEATDKLQNALRDAFAGKRLFSTTVLDGTV
jgi:DNA-binding NarL/FixJ family response regulator